jgi:hypothetical protein
MGVKIDFANSLFLYPYLNHELSPKSLFLVFPL